MLGTQVRRTDFSERAKVEAMLDLRGAFPDVSKGRAGGPCPRDDWHLHMIVRL
jgi:hypothetical protein